MPDLTLIEKLRQIEAQKHLGDPIPSCLGNLNEDWVTVLSAICKEAAETIEGLEVALASANMPWAR